MACTCSHLGRPGRTNQPFVTRINGRQTNLQSNLARRHAASLHIPHAHGSAQLKQQQDVEHARQQQGDKPDKRPGNMHGEDCTKGQRRPEHCDIKTPPNGTNTH